jgi:hypothetical protein
MSARAFLVVLVVAALVAAAAYIHRPRGAHAPLSSLHGGR